jgi:predicted esterase
VHGYYELRVPGLSGEGHVPYYLQLPPEYDPYRRYPAIVTLNGTGSTPRMQLDWWAGEPDEQGKRNGQAARHGYITIAVDWQKPSQRQYEYSARAHHAVLACLRDACRRFAVDTDRVFLSGHSIGGDAAWDLGLSHPDLWAGVIPIVAVADRFCSHYWENARHVPFYFVAGELDGDKMQRNAKDLDRYLRHRYDVTVVEYLGRGHEHFYEEIHQLLEWMGRRERDFFPEQFRCATLREWDNFFWWVEMHEFPPRSTVDPVGWPPRRGTRALKVEGRITNNNVFIKTASRRVGVWLSPELVDFQRRVTVTVNGRRIDSGRSPIQPDLATLLEDVRTRGDRQHPFWLKVQNR